ncbi:hypothetical protein BDQ17DRAFT_1345254 [Cyathus striatus]|nr:hypothetical protein BDQ17DRAFT_1345254 [Cyathus striatus]
MSIPPRPPPFLTDSLCFSSASILRCSPLNQVENGVLIIPTALEILFTTSLLFIIKDGGWHHLFLTIETWLYLVLAMLEVISHVLPAARDSVQITKGFDLAIGILAPLPLLLYMSFIYLFARQELIYTLPRRFQRVLNLMLPIFIPVITVVNAVASFVGVQIRTDPRTTNIPLIGFPTARDSTLWSFFTSLTLAILTLFQAIVFLIALHRLLSILVNQRRIENTSRDAIHLVKGVGWINAAIKLGAVESVLGFVGGSFGLFMVRRILRFAARVAWCIGIARGVDELEDFRAIQSEMSRSASRRQNGNLRTLISNPRLSTFREMSPSATMFHSSLRQVPQGELAPALNQFSRLRNEVYTSEMANIPRQRVTISYDSPRGAPTLHMRLSSVQLPDPVKLADSIKARSRKSTQATWVNGIRGSRSSVSGFIPLEQGRERMSSLQWNEREKEYYDPEKTSSQEKAREKSWISQWTEGEKRSSYFPPSQQPRNSLFVPQKEERNSSSQLSSVYTPSVCDPPEIVSALRRTVSRTRGVIVPASAVASSVLDVFVTAPSMRYVSAISPTTEDTSRSLDTVDILRELTPQFPPTPLNMNDIPLPSPASSEGFSPRLADQDKGKTPILGGLPSPPSSNSSTPRPTISRPQPLRPMPSPKRYSAPTSPSQPRISPKHRSGVSPGIIDFGMALSQTKIREWRRDGRSAAIFPTSAEAAKGLPPHLEIDENVQTSSSLAQSNLATGRATFASTDVLAVPWLYHPDLDEDKSQPRVRADSSTSSLAYPMRIKSVGNAPRRATPVPVRTRVAKRSTHLEPLIIPPLPHVGKTEVIQEFSGSLEGGGGRDSEVLGNEDARMVKQLRDVRAYYSK